MQRYDVLLAALVAAPITSAPSVSPLLIVPAEAISDDIVVSGQLPVRQIILQQIRSHDPDFAAVTDGLIEGAKPTPMSGAAIEQHLAAEAARTGR